ncbi:MAG: hypothetical protein WBQ23_08420 [Bacteroidota bacterium]
MRWPLAHIEVLALSLLLFAACENTVDTPDWPAHDEKLVVTGFLRIEHDSLFAYARVNRTLPLGEKYDLQKAMVNDAELQVTNGSRSFPIPHTQGFYPFDFDFNYGAVTTRGSDDSFVLSVMLGGKTATAALQAKFSATRFTNIRVETSPDDKYLYIVTYLIPAPGPDTDVECLMEYWSPGFNNWYKIHSERLPWLATRPDGVLEGRFIFWGAGSGSVSKQRIRYTLIARNSAYQDYINSRWDWINGDTPFDPPQKNPRFNITGDGIGFFWYEVVGDPVEIQY